MLAGLFCAGAAFAADRFDSIKADLARAECTEFEFISVIESEIFDQTDSTSGVAYIAHDGRYNVHVGRDQYLFDGTYLYSYSADNNQVVIEDVAAEDEISREISFITRLDQFYLSHPVNPDREYRLTKKKGVEGDMPDSAVVFINSEDSKIDRLEYYDVNDELTVITILQQHSDSVCNEGQFKPAYPDSVERVKL
jgi:outer membrane lipoprotein-sorting protein